MKSRIYIPLSCQAAEKDLDSVLKGSLHGLRKKDFVRGWHALSYLYPGLHPEGYASRGSGWPKQLKLVAAEAWRRFEAGELTDNELYCHQVCRARVALARAEVMRTVA